MPTRPREAGPTIGQYIDSKFPERTAGPMRALTRVEQAVFGLGQQLESGWYRLIKNRPFTRDMAKEIRHGLMTSRKTDRIAAERCIKALDIFGM